MKIMTLMMLMTVLSSSLYADIFISAEKGNVEELKKWIDKGIDVNLYQNKLQPLDVASFYGHIEAVKVLIEAGAYTNSSYPLYLAIRGGQLELVKYFIENNIFSIPPKGSTNYYKTYTMCAVANGKLDIVKYLFERGDDISVASDDFRNLTALSGAIMVNYTDIALYLIDNRENNDSINLESDYSTDRFTRSNMTPLMMASKLGNKEVVKALIDAKADVNVQGSVNGTTGFTALTYASENGYLDIVKLLVEEGALINSGYISMGWLKNPLYLATENNHTNVVNYLKEKGAE